MVKPMKENSRRETTFNSTIKKIFHFNDRFLNKVRSLILIVSVLFFMKIVLLLSILDIMVEVEKYGYKRYMDSI